MTQADALDILKLGHNVFLTGPAGSGKTYLLNQYISFLRAHKIPVGITASTGIAATHMGGVTIHSWSGIGIKEFLSQEDIANLLKKRYLQKHLKQTKVLIIDEISMLHARQLDMIDLICRVFRNNSAPFGGLQVIMCGDFFQLPPIDKSSRNRPVQVTNDQTSDVYQETLLEQNNLQPEGNKNFVYNSDVWNNMHLQICYLDEQHRQDDRLLLRILNDIRNNEVDEMTVEYLSERLDKNTEGYARPTRLFTHNADVDAINKKHLDELPGEEHEYVMHWRGGIHLVEGLKKSCLAPEKLVLKKGAQVMFVKNNFDAGYVNGTLGEVIGFDKDEYPIIRTFDGAEITVGRASWEVKEENIELAAIAQIPIRLAWAITVHKSQGMSLDAAEIDLSRSFVPGMGYVALSRVRSLSGLKLMGMNQMALQVNPHVALMDQQFIEGSHEVMQYLHAMTPEKKLQTQQAFLEYLLK